MIVFEQEIDDADLKAETIENESSSELQVTDVFLNEQGLLIMKFDKRLAIPEIYRNITSSDDTVLIESLRAWINLSVRSDYYEEDQPEISIRN